MRYETWIRAKVEYASINGTFDFTLYMINDILFYVEYGSILLITGGPYVECCIYVQTVIYLTLFYYRLSVGSIGQIDNKRI